MLHQIAHSTLRKLTDVKGISDQKAAKLKEIIKANNLVCLGFQTASSRLEGLRDLIMISTGDPPWLSQILIIINTFVSADYRISRIGQSSGWWN